VDALDLPVLVRQFAWARLGVAGILLLAGAPLARTTLTTINYGWFAAALGVTMATSAAVLVGHRLGLRLAWTRSALLALDVVTATLVVLFTGGPESIFAFVYVLVVIASCVLLPRQGAMAVAGACSLLYTAVVLAHTMFALGDSLVTEVTSLAVLSMFMNTGTFLVVAITAGSLAEHYRSAHHELEDQRKDLSDLQAFRDLIFESVGTGLIALDGVGQITAYNRAAADITGVPAGHAIGRPWNSLFGPDARIDEILAAVHSGPRAFRRFEFSVRRADASDVPVAVTFWALRSGTGEIVGLIAVCEDLSPLKEMEARMRQADRLAAVGRMAANIAHEIRNPLASITGAIEVLVRDADAGGARERLAQIVTRESERLDHIIRDLLEYARPAPLALQPMDLADTLDDVLLLIEHRPLPEQVKVVRAYAPPLPVLADTQQVRQVMWNLCLNAVEAMRDSGELRVGARRHEDRVKVWVSDTGPGIQAEHLAHIFEPFFSTKAGGSGIGLALVHRIVQDHGGDVDVRTGPGEGTTFTIHLPAAGA
jgi:two-component system sensor histidine kinase PilS (NtrC family)